MDERIEKWLYDIRMAIPIAQARKIVNLRNYIIHAYDSISDENIWAIIINNLPKLKKDIDELIPIIE